MTEVESLREEVKNLKEALDRFHAMYPSCERCGGIIKNNRSKYCECDPNPTIRALKEEIEGYKILLMKAIKEIK